ncbi:MAG: ribonuclease E inhibitor RraB [Gammaproteobacteria bacterium]|nr:ribonuclease E inhibitor RraB [Gammaproteobacteria bacterium]
MSLEPGKLRVPNDPWSQVRNKLMPTLKVVDRDGKIAGAAIAVWRIVYQLRRASKVQFDDWDTKLIEKLRRSGVDPFQPVDVDFFVALPTREVADTIASRLQAEGFTVDIRELADSVDLPWSVHALKSMSLNVHAVREVSTRMRGLAAETGGRYDGWAPGPGKPIG